MRWFKHLSGIGRSPAMAELRSVLGLAAYVAFWLVLERIAEAWDGSGEPELCLPEREWRICCDLSAKKFQIVTEILQKHDIIRVEQCGSLLRLKASILLQLQDEWTRKARKNSGVPPEPYRSNSGIQTDRDPEKEKDNKTRPAIVSVLKRHGIQLDSERGRNILHYVEQKQPANPGGYLERILQQKADFDPWMGESQPEHNMLQTGRSQTARQQEPQSAPQSAKDILQRLHLPAPPGSGLKGEL
jgi:hypothetical protein